MTTFDATRGDEAHRWPQFLPDGRHFVFMPWKLGSAKRSIQLGSLDGGATRTLVDTASAALVGGTYLLFTREQPSQLMAQAFNPRTLVLEGRPAPVVADDNVAYWWASGEPWASSTARTLVYTTGSMRISQLTWFSRTGRVLGTVGEPDVYYDPTLAPDGARLAVEKRDRERGTTDLWTVALARGVFSRLTDAPGFEDVATWSPDGRRIAFASDQGSVPSIWAKNANGTGTDERFVEGRAFPMAWSKDGSRLLYMTDRGATRTDILVLDTERHASSPLLASPSNEECASFSPDGKWIAYTSDEARDKQVYVRSYPDAATKMQISTGGGIQPQWRGDGRELFYLAPDSTLMGVEVRPSGAGLSVGVAQPLFLTNIIPEQFLRNGYVASADGQRFLVVSPQVNPNSSPLVGVLNWQSALAARSR